MSLKQSKLRVPYEAQLQFQSFHVHVPSPVLADFPLI